MSVNGDLLHYLTIEAVSLPHMCKHDFFFLIWNSGACICYRYILMCDVRPVGISQVLLKTSGPVSVLIVLCPNRLRIWCIVRLFLAWFRLVHLRNSSFVISWIVFYFHLLCLLQTLNSGPLLLKVKREHMLSKGKATSKRDHKPYSLCS